MITEPWTYLVWCLLALVLVGTGLFRAERRRVAGAGAPGMLTSAAIWIGVILLVVLMYRGMSLWTALGSMFR